MSTRPRSGGQSIGNTAWRVGECWSRNRFRRGAPSTSHRLLSQSDVTALRPLWIAANTSRCTGSSLRMRRGKNWTVYSAGPRRDHTVDGAARGIVQDTHAVARRRHARMEVWRHACGRRATRWWVPRPRGNPGALFLWGLGARLTGGCDAAGIARDVDGDRVAFAIRARSEESIGDLGPGTGIFHRPENYAVRTQGGGLPSLGLDHPAFRRAFARAFGVQHRDLRIRLPHLA